VVDKVLADKEIQRMLDECWKDGAKTYIKQDPSFKDIPGFESRRFSPPKRIPSIQILSHYRPIQENAL
jgi:hypothetical protein